MILVFLGWLIIHAIVFSLTSGTIHPYYVIVMAPAIAALVGATLPTLWQTYKNHKFLWLFLPAAIGLTTYTSYIILGYKNYLPILSTIVLVTGGASIILLIINKFKSFKPIQYLAIITGVTSCLIGPAYFTLTTINVSHTGSIPTSGPSGTSGKTNNESSQANSQLINFLLTNQGSADWIIAVASANESAPIQITSGQPVMAIGGFKGNDNIITLEEFKQLVADGKIKYYLSSNGNNRGGPSGNGNSSISSWATTNGTIVDYGNTSEGTLYDLSQII